MPGPCYFNYGYEAPGELEYARHLQSKPIDTLDIQAWLRDMESASRPGTTEGVAVPAADRGDAT